MVHMTAQEKLKNVLGLVNREFPNEVDNMLVLNVRGVPVLRWAYQSPFSGLDAVDDVCDAISLFFHTVGTFICIQGLLTASEATGEDFGIVDYVLDGESLQLYNRVYEKIRKDN